RQVLAARVEQRLRGSALLVDAPGGPGARRRRLGERIGLGPRRGRAALRDEDQLAHPRDLLLHAGRLAQRARLLVGELLDLAPDLRAKRATSPLERFELAGVAGDLALQPCRALGQRPGL